MSKADEPEAINCYFCGGNMESMLWPPAMGTSSALYDWIIHELRIQSSHSLHIGKVL
jgi:hypothetical protein